MTANEGPDKNVILLLPPMCFTCDNARHLVQAFDKTLSDIEKEALEVQQGLGTSESIEVPLSILTGNKHKLDSEDSDSDLESPSKRTKHNYEEVD